MLLIPWQNIWLPWIRCRKGYGIIFLWRPDKKIPKIYKNGYINSDLFKIGKDVTDIYLNTKKYPYLNSDDFQVKLTYLMHCNNRHKRM